MGIISRLSARTPLPWLEYPLGDGTHVFRKKSEWIKESKPSDAATLQFGIEHDFQLSKSLEVHMCAIPHS